MPSLINVLEPGYEVAQQPLSVLAQLCVPIRFYSKIYKHAGMYYKKGISNARSSDKRKDCRNYCKILNEQVEEDITSISALLLLNCYDNVRSKEVEDAKSNGVRNNKERHNKQRGNRQNHWAF